MQLKSQIKNGKVIQKRPSQAAPSEKSIKQQKQPPDPRFKYKSNPISHLPNSASSKKLYHNTIHSRPQERPDSHSLNNSNLSRPHNSQSFIMVDRVVQLHQRLKNLHLFYKTKIQEEKAKTSQRNEVFMSIIEEMQHSHNDKMLSLKQHIEEEAGQKKDVGLVDERMNEIKGSIDEILKQSSDLKVSNERLERQINEKEHVLRQKDEELGKIKEELMEARNQLEGFERLNLRQNKRNKEIVAMIEKVESSLPHQNHR